jgi:hypothetical protein
MKTCSLCGVSQPSSEYWKRPGTRDGLRASCKSCHIIQQQNWLSKNRDRKSEADRAFHQSNKLERNKRSQQYFIANRVAQLECRKAYWDKHIEHLREKKRINRQANIEAIRAKNRQHYAANKQQYVVRARMREKHIARATPSWANLDKIAAIYEEAARLTAETGITHHVDHFYPLRSKTMCGLHVETNLQILTAEDNLRKSNKPPVSESLGAL